MQASFAFDISQALREEGKYMTTPYVYANFFPQHAVNAVAAHVQNAASNREGIFAPTGWDFFGRKKALARQAQTLVTRYEKNKHTLGFVVGLIDLYRRDYFRTIGARFATVPVSAVEKTVSDYGHYSNSALALHEAFTGAAIYPKDDVIYVVGRPISPSHTFLLRSRDIHSFNCFMLWPMTLDEATFRPRLVSSLLIGALLIFSAEQGWKLELESEIDSSPRRYAEKFLRRSRPLYLGAHDQRIHGERAHPFEIMYHDLFHLDPLLCSFTGVLYYGEAQFKKQSRIIQATLAALDELGVDDLVNNFSEASLLSGLAEGYDILQDSLLSGIPEDQKRAFLKLFYKKYYELFSMAAPDLEVKPRGVVATV